MPKNKILDSEIVTILQYIIAFDEDDMLIITSDACFKKWRKTMKDKKVETFKYAGLGFPIELINVPMKKIFGEWVLDINLSKLQLEVLNILIHQPTALQAGELRFIRKYFEMTTTAFGEVFGVSHAAVLKWESGLLLSPPMDMYIRMYVMDRLQAKNDEFGKLYHQVSLASLAKSRKKRSSCRPFVINAKNSKFAYV